MHCSSESGSGYAPPLSSQAYMLSALFRPTPVAATASFESSRTLTGRCSSCTSTSLLRNVRDYRDSQPWEGSAEYSPSGCSTTPSSDTALQATFQPTERAQAVASTASRSSIVAGACSCVSRILPECRTFVRGRGRRSSRGMHRRARAHPSSASSSTNTHAQRMTACRAHALKLSRWGKLRRPITERAHQQRPFHNARFTKCFHTVHFTQQGSCRFWPASESFPVALQRRLWESAAASLAACSAWHAAPVLRTQPVSITI